MPGRGEVPSRPIRVLYSFPHKLGADRICYTAWQQVVGLDKAGAKVICMPGVLHRSLPGSIDLRTTLSFGSLCVSYRLLGTMRALAIHDRIVAGRLAALRDDIDIVHTWPSAARETLKAAAQLGIPTVLERPNAHTRYAYESVQAEAARIGVALPSNNEYALKQDVLLKEEEEYQLADYLLCPSDFTIKTFVDRGTPAAKLKKHGYGFDETRFYPSRDRKQDDRSGLQVLFAGDAAVRKGVHFGLEAWMQSAAHTTGKLLIAGTFLPAYAERLRPFLSDPSVEVLGHRNDLPDLMRSSDILILPSVEEGFGLVCVEAIGCGCVPLVSEACTDTCRHRKNALVHRIGDVATLATHLTLLHENRGLLARLRAQCIEDAPTLTWSAAGQRLLEIYGQVLDERRSYPGDSSVGPGAQEYLERDQRQRNSTHSRTTLAS
jgi:glycosyltransferase involved in cell wall biosynthesis